jgi:hypothetical protein
MSKKWPAKTIFQEETLYPTITICPVCGKPLASHTTRRRCLYRFTGPTRLVCHLVRCVNPQCAAYHHHVNPETESQIALPRWRLDWAIFLWLGFRRFTRHWSIPQLQAELRDTYESTLSDTMLADYLRHYQTMVAAWYTDFSQLQTAYRDISDLILTIDGIQPEKGHETVYVVRELRQHRVWFAETLLSSATEEIQRIIQRARLLSEQLRKPVRGWMSDKQDAFVTAIAEEFPGVPHRYCANHFLRDIAAPMLAVDRTAKVRMRHKVRGLRALERLCLPPASNSLGEGHGFTPDECQWAAQIVLSYCALVRGILNDHHGGPLWPAGWNMACALREVSASIARNLAAPSTPISSLLTRLQGCIQRGLVLYQEEQVRIGTALGQVLVVWALVHPEPDKHHVYQEMFHQYADQYSQSKDLITQHIGQTMHHFEEGLFCGGEALDLPEDNLDLERWIRGPKGHERRIHGRKHVGLRIVVEAPTLLLAFDAHLDRQTPFTVQELLPYANAEIPVSQQQAMRRHQLMRKARSKKNAKVL